MKNITMIVHAEVKQALADTMRSLKQVSGFTFTIVEGHGAQDGLDHTLSARDRVVGYTPQVRVDILLEDSDIDDVLQALRTADCGLAGRGVYWISPVNSLGKL